MIETGNPARAAWIDCARGICIILVVMMHSALGIERATGGATGWFHAVVAWTKPFRMPDFFILCGFLAGGIGALSWRDFWDRKVLHYAYFYLLWLVIVIVVKSTADASENPTEIVARLANGLVEPFSTLWFIYILPFLMLGTRLAQGRAAVAIIVGAIFLHFVAANYPTGGAFAMASQMTSSTTVNSFALFFIFFLAGYFGHQLIKDIAYLVDKFPLVSLFALAVWAIVHSAALHFGITDVPGFTLLFGVAGGLAVAVSAILIVHAGGLGWLSYCGRHSLAIYLAFVIPMAATRELLVQTGVLMQPDLLAIVTLGAAILLPLFLESITAGQTFQFLFKRPIWARLPNPGTMR